MQTAQRPDIGSLSSREPVIHIVSSCKHRSTRQDGLQRQSVRRSGRRDRPGQASVKADEPEAGSADRHPAPDNALGDYRLAPGDRLTIAVFDEPQLSGDFFIDGGGEVLLPLAGSVRISGLTLAEAQALIQKQFADGVLTRPAVSLRIMGYRPIFVAGVVQEARELPLYVEGIGQGAIATAGGVGQAFTTFSVARVRLHNSSGALAPTRGKSGKSSRA